MTRRRVLGLIVAGVSATAVGLLVAVVGVEPTSPGTDPGWGAMLVAVCGLIVAAWLVLTSRSAIGRDRSAPWTASDPLVYGQPEATDGRARLTGGELGRHVRAAGDIAREQRDVTDGIAHVRPLLREAYREIAAMDQSVTDPDRALAAGTWTEDRVAAETLSEQLTGPTRSRRQRLRDWLYPGRAVTRQVSRAVDALATYADNTVPTVVGQSAPRQVPVHEPSLAARTVGIDGEFPRAAIDRPDGEVSYGPDGTETGEGAVDRDTSQRDGHGDGRRAGTQADRHATAGPTDEPAGPDGGTPE